MIVLPPRPRRDGQTLALFALLLPVLVGMVGLVIDTGLLLAAYRQTQNAADAAALAAAHDRLAGTTDGVARATATTYVQNNGLSNATVQVNIPPGQGPYASNANYVEVIVTNSVPTWFIQVLGPPATSPVSARAVAGFEAMAAPQAVAALDPTAIPGLAVNQATLHVNGPVMVNSQGAGFDAGSRAVNLGYPSYAITTGSAGLLYAPRVDVVGGVDSPANIQPSSAGPSPLNAGTLLRSDPLLYLPSPTTASGVLVSYPGVNSQTFSSPQDVSVTVTGGLTVVFSPGIYRSIDIAGAGPGTVSFQSGLYVLLGGNTNGRALNIITGATVTGSSVIFYNTGNDYDVTTGLPDAGDVNNPPPGKLTTRFGSLTIDAPSFTLTPLNDPTSPFAGLWLYQRRWNGKAIVLRNTGPSTVSGTLYARWAAVTLNGPGTYNGQFLSGSLTVAGSGLSTNATIAYGPKLAKANLVFLVE